jgi:hypothetical protein
MMGLMTHAANLGGFAVALASNKKPGRLTPACVWGERKARRLPSFAPNGTIWARTREVSTLLLGNVVYRYAANKPL